MSKSGHGRGAMNSLIIHSQVKSTFQERRSASLAIRVFRGSFTSLDMIRTCTLLRDVNPLTQTRLSKLDRIRRETKVFQIGIWCSRGERHPVPKPLSWCSLTKLLSNPGKMLSFIGNQTLERKVYLTWHDGNGSPRIKSSDDVETIETGSNTTKV